MRASIHVVCASILLAEVALASEGTVVRVVRTPAVEVASQATPSTSEAVLADLESGFVTSWARYQSARSRFTRALMPPSEARARLQEATARTDARGASFFAFAVDTRSSFPEANWNLATLTGCIYPEQGTVYVRRGESYRTAKSFLGERGAEAPRHACTSVAARSTGEAR